MRESINKQYFIGKNNCFYDCENIAPDFAKEVSLSLLDIAACGNLSCSPVGLLASIRPLLTSCERSFHIPRNGTEAGTEK